MRVNCYTEELLLNQHNGPIAEIVTAEYVSPVTGKQMTNYGLRIYLKSHADLHFTSDGDDDRSAVTFWCGAEKKNIFDFMNGVLRAAAA
jgi:hypothetical protein